MEILALILGCIIVWLFVKVKGGGIFTFFIVWTITTMLSGIALALFGFFFGLVLFVGIIIAFIWLVKNMITG